VKWAAFQHLFDDKCCDRKQAKSRTCGSFFGIEVALQGSPQWRADTSSLPTKEEDVLILSGSPKAKDFLGLCWVRWAFAIQNQCSTYGKWWLFSNSSRICHLGSNLLTARLKCWEWGLLLHLKAGGQEKLTVVT